VAKCFQQRVGYAANGFLGGFVLSVLSLLSVRRRRKNIESSSKSNPLRLRGKNYDVKAYSVVVEKMKNVDELSIKIRAIYLQQ